MSCYTLFQGMATFKPTSQVLRTPRSHTPTVFDSVTFPLVLVCRLQELGHARYYYNMLRLQILDETFSSKPPSPSGNHSSWDEILATVS